nr:homoserine O-acetyltransferase [Segniliparus rugosus]
MDRTPSSWTHRPDGEPQRALVGSVALDRGGALSEVVIAFRRWGKPTPNLDNVVLVLHALTGDDNVAGADEPDGHRPGWWDGTVGRGAVLDTNRWCVVAANVLGGCNGSTGPSSPAADGRAWGSRFPRITVRDQVRAEVALADVLGIQRFASVIGGSMGGARALEWLVGHPERVASGLVLAVGARASADQIGTQTAQIQAIEADPDWHGGDYYDTGRVPLVGMGIARRFAHLTYRSEAELDERFQNTPQGDEEPLWRGRYAISSYLDHQARKLAVRFDPGSYVALSGSLNHHDVGRGRGGVEAALAGCAVPTVVAGIDSDRLYPLHQQAQIAKHLAAASPLRVIHSQFGHDGFLVEAEAVGKLIAETLTLAERG